MFNSVPFVASSWFTLETDKRTIVPYGRNCRSATMKSVFLDTAKESMNMCIPVILMLRNV